MIDFNMNIKKIVTIGLMSTIVFLGTYLTRIDISLFGGSTMIHLGNMVCLVVAILFGPRCGGLAGAIGMSLFDVFSGKFVLYFPFTFILKYFVGYVCGYIKIKNVNKIERDKLNCLSILGGLIINVIFSPIISFFIKVVVYDLNFYVAIVSIIGSMISVVINAVLSGFLTFILVKFLEPIVFNKRYINR